MMSNSIKKALITGITGQDGSYLSEFLLDKGYEVHGLVRRASTFNTERIEHLYKDPHIQDARLRLHYGDVTDTHCMRRLLDEVQPDEVYNLAAQSHVRVSFELPINTAEITGVGTIRQLESIREYQDSTNRQVRFYQASSSEMFGKVLETPQKETTPFNPRSPYGAAKVFSHMAAVNYREAYNMHVSCGILFNHESPRRGETFVTRKITRAAGRIKLGLQKRLFLGNLDAQRDWGFAGDYVKAMWLMLQQDKPDDYVVATGRTASVKEFLELVFAELDLDYRDHVDFDPRYVRPTEVDLLLGDASKAHEELGWHPEVDLEGLARMMVKHDLRMAERDKALIDAGHMPENAFDGGSD